MKAMVNKNFISPFNLHKISYYPSQMDISISEKCNQDCDYCWVSKSSAKILDFRSIKRAIDIFLGFPLQEQTITFTTSEPLLFPDLYKKTIDYILSKYTQKNIKLITTTNGLLLNKDMRDFIIKRISNKFRLNISLDGSQKSHDFHRKLAKNLRNSSFELSWRNFRELPRDKARVIFTITPSELGGLRKNLDFIFANNFTKIDLFPQMFTLWSVSDLNKLKKEMALTIDILNQNDANNYDLRILNRLWGDSHYAKLLLASDGKFYLFEWVLALPHSKRKRYIIGDTEEGVNLSKRQLLFNSIFNEVTGQYHEVCLDCEYKRLCSYPLPLFMWCKYHGHNFKEYFNNFCLIAKIFIGLSLKMKNDIKNELDSLKLAKYL